MLNRTIETATEKEREVKKEKERDRAEQRDRYFVRQQLKKVDACFISQFPVALSGFSWLYSIRFCNF